MKYLFIDTCSNCLIISTIINNKIDYFFIDKNNNDTSSKVMKVLKEAVPDINTVDKIFVVNGPGSFTGIRVGVTIAKTIGFCLNIPIIKISELELLASTNTDTDYMCRGIFTKVTNYNSIEDLIASLSNNYEVLGVGSSLSINNILFSYFCVYKDDDTYLFFAHEDNNGLYLYSAISYGGFIDDNCLKYNLEVLSTLESVN